ncbi:MAG: TonB-dependent receptor [Pseudomonadota bacterium]
MKNIKLGLSVSMAALLASAGAMAQDSVYEEFLVTAQKRSESINDVPISIQAYGQETLENAGVRDITQLQLLASGLSFAKSSANTPILTIRGVGFNTPNLSSTSPVGVYWDEVAYAYPYMAGGPVFDIERVEVLKGPQGTLYGRNNTGGLINFIAAKPTDDFEAGVRGEFGNFETYNFEAFVSGAITDTLRMRVSGRWENSDNGWQNAITRDDRLGQKDRLGLRAIIDFEPTDRLSFQVIGNHWRDKSDTVAGQAVLFNPDNPGFENPGLQALVRTDWDNDIAGWDPDDGSKPPFETDAEFYSISGRITYDINDSLSVVSLTGFNSVDRRDNNDVDGTAIEVFTQLSDGGIDSFSQELRLQGESGDLSYIVGGYFSRDEINDNQIGFIDQASAIQFLRFLAQNLVDPMNMLFSPEEYAGGFRSYRNISEQTNRSMSLFGNVDWDLADTFTLSAGLRYTDDKLQHNTCSADFEGNTRPIWTTAVFAAVNLGTGNVPNYGVDVDQCMVFANNFTDRAAFERPDLSEDNVAGRLSLTYEPSEDLLVYASISRGFKSGAIPVLTANVESQFDPARQERVMAYEIGTKASLADRAIQLNMAAFYYDYTDKQLFAEVLDPVFTTLPKLVNIPGSRVFGLETDISWRATPELTFRSAVTYTNAEVTNYQGFNRFGQPQDFEGARFAFTPKWTVNGSVDYDRDLTSDLGIKVFLAANYQSATSGSLLNEPGFEVESYAVVNGSINLYSLNESWQIGLFANNLFDTYYWTSTDTIADTVFRIPGPPRTFGATVSWRF